MPKNGVRKDRFVKTADERKEEGLAQESYRILVCDDDFDIVQALEIYLEKAGYQVVHAYNGRQVLQILEKEDIHLILLDIMMPLMDGLEALKEIRKSRSLPVILLSAKGENTDKVEGLLSGADDYITKPFQASELLARVKSQLRRYTTFPSYHPEKSDQDHLRHLGALTLDQAKALLYVEGREVALTPLEFSILWFLMDHPGQVFSSEEIYQAVWQEASFGSVSTVAVHIRHLREKIEIDPKNPRYLKVVWGKGYKMEDLA